MKFNNLYEENKDLKGFNNIIKYITILNNIIILICCLTFIPVTSLTFIVNAVGMIIRHLSLPVMLYLVIYLIKLYKIQFNIENNKFVVINIALSVINIVAYLICFYFNVINLFI